MHLAMGQEVTTPKETSETETYYQKRLNEEKKASKLNYSIIGHKPTYILPITYNSHPTRGSLDRLTKTDYLETKLQFSFKFNVVNKFLFNKVRLAFAYTNLSFWQLYNSQNSAPFRETNHEPDLFAEYRRNGIDSVLTDPVYRLGFVHQSNGQDMPNSRSWNRIYVQGIFNTPFLIYNLKIWHRLKEGSKLSILDSRGDDNPGITDYVGDFELMLIKKFAEQTFTLILHNNLQKDNRGSMQLDWSFPLNENYRGYIQFYNGYGESLIDYNKPVERIGAGFLIADWF